MKQDKPTDNGKTNSDLENCAILGLHLPQPTEYEYLRNILFEFMMGREPVVRASTNDAAMSPDLSLNSSSSRPWPK